MEFKPICTSFYFYYTLLMSGIYIEKKLKIRLKSVWFCGGKGFMNTLTTVWNDSTELNLMESPKYSCTPDSSTDCLGSALLSLQLALQLGV